MTVVTSQKWGVPSINSGQNPPVGPEKIPLSNGLPAVPKPPPAPLTTYRSPSGAMAPGPSHPASGPAIYGPVRSPYGY